jgi:hypothetical protein
LSARCWSLFRKYPAAEVGRYCPLGQSQPGRVDTGRPLNSVAAIERCGP